MTFSSRFIICYNSPNSVVQQKKSTPPPQLIIRPPTLRNRSLSERLLAAASNYDLYSEDGTAIWLDVFSPRKWVFNMGIFNSITMYRCVGLLDRGSAFLRDMDLVHLTIVLPQYDQFKRCKWSSFSWNILLKVANNPVRFIHDENEERIYI